MTFIVLSCAIVSAITFFTSLKKDTKFAVCLNVLTAFLFTLILSIGISNGLEGFIVTEDEDYITSIESIEKLYPIVEENSTIYLINRWNGLQCQYITSEKEKIILNKKISKFNVVYIDINSPYQSPCVVKYNKKYSNIIKRILLISPESYYTFYIPKKGMILE